MRANGCFLPGADFETEAPHLQFGQDYLVQARAKICPKPLGEVTTQG